MGHPLLLSVPNVSEGRDAATVCELARAFSGVDAGAGAQTTPATEVVRLLDVHSDGDHHRSVFTLAGPQGRLAQRLLAGARVAVERVDILGRVERGAAGQHPHVGAIDIVPIVYLDEAVRGAACAEALATAEEIGSGLEIPVFLYGELTADAGGPPRTRAQLRRGGVTGLAARLAAGEQPAPDFGPNRLHPTAGATLVAARPPLVAFNLRLAAPATLADARAVAAAIREGGSEGLPGLRAIGIELGGGVAQVSMNVEQPLLVPLAEVVMAVRARAPVAAAELVGLAPAAALAGFPQDLPMPGFDPERHVIENALGC